MLEQKIQPAVPTESVTHFPRVRPRRMRRTENLRALVRETEVNARDFIYPLFVVHGTNRREEIGSIPGVYHLSLDVLAREIEGVSALGIPAVILFGLPARKDELGSEDYDEHGIAQEAIRACKRVNPEPVVVTDVCMCQYTSHGHCGIVRDGQIDNDETLKYLALTAVSHAAAGAEIVAPSARVATIRVTVTSLSSPWWSLAQNAFR